MSKEKIVNILYSIYAFLFIFTMINKEFLLFGIDLRFILLPIGAILIILSFTEKNKKIEDYDDKIGRLLIAFYIYAFVANISWIWNGLKIDEGKFINEIILLSNIFISLLVFYRYKSRVNQSKLNKFIIISTVVLLISMILVSCGLPLSKISGSADVPYIYTASEQAPDNKNLFGGNFRAAGYASDPNYATLLLVIACVATLKLETEKKYKAILMIIFIAGIGLACSKTILTAIIFSAVVVIIDKYAKPKKEIINAFNLLFVVGIILANIIIINIPNINQYMPSTLTTRFSMWNCARKLFLKSPIIGNGITSFRSYFSINHWYVQCHSTYWQILSELGVVGIVLFALIAYKVLKKNQDDKIKYCMILIYLIYAITCETIALQFIIYILYIVGIDNNKRKIGKKALFMVNSLSNGGAERVCINMANELIAEGYNIDFILLGNNKENRKSYELNKDVKIFNLEINEKSKIKKTLKIISSVNKIDDFILQQEKDEKYSLITSHLPMANIMTRLSIVNKRSLYVFHTSLSNYDKLGSKKLFRVLIHYMFDNRKIVAVSEGVKKECIDEYHLQKSNIKTIYNPVDENEVTKKAQEPIDEIDYKYLLLVGRFNEAKRQDRMVEIFYKGEFYKNYKLVFCGTGILEDKIKNQVKELGISDRVIFLGWQSNVYKWMKNAEILVSTSDNEAFPMNLIEAIICGTRIVASNCKFGPDEILKGNFSKFLVETDNIEQYIEKINLALREYPNEENPIISECNPKNIIKKYLEFMK